jgi:hypothetical protein
MNRPKKTLRRNLHQAKKNYADQVHSDQMVLGTVRWEDGPRERRPKALKRQANLRGTIMIESNQIRWFL